MRAGLLAAVAASLLSASAGAFDDEHAEVRFHGRTYAYTFSAVLDAPLPAVRAVVTDYARLARLNDSITDSRVLERDGPHALRRLLALRHCLLLFCFDMRFVEDVRIAGDDALTVITTTVIPAASSFRDGVAEWRLEARGPARTRLTLTATQTPDFWIPPVIGPLILERVFVREVRETSTNIERLAAAAAP
ncbi:MAG: SRPBCC family protein [Gammaproteobacteria bacterium]